MELTVTDHIGILTDDLDEAASFFTSHGGEVVYDERNEDHDTRVAFVDVGGVYFEFLQPYGEGMVMDAYEKHGPGFEHVAYRVPDVDAAVSELRSEGITFQADQPRPGAGSSRIIYLDPEHTAGLEVELVELSPDDVRARREG